MKKLKLKILKLKKQEPFRTVGSVVSLFKNNMNDAKAILDIVDQIKFRRGSIIKKLMGNLIIHEFF